MKTESGAPVSQFEGNAHSERKFDDNVTILRSLRAPEPRLEADQFYARQLESPNIASGIRLEKLCGGVIISKSFQHIAIKSLGTAVLVQVKDPKQCWMFR